MLGRNSDFMNDVRMCIIIVDIWIAARTTFYNLCENRDTQFILYWKSYIEQDCALLIHTWA